MAGTCSPCATPTGRPAGLEGLHNAAELPPLKEGAKGWLRGEIPLSLRITVRRGFAGTAFGPLPLAAPVKAGPALKVGPTAKGPAWFRAMDRNGDGFVSPAEFLGPPELFRQLDLNGDGLISTEEAERAEGEQGRASECLLEKATAVHHGMVLQL